MAYFVFFQSMLKYDPTYFTILEVKVCSFTGKYVFMHLFRRTFVNIRFSKIQKYVLEKYDIFQKYEYVFPKYDWSKGKRANAWLDLYTLK